MMLGLFVLVGISKISIIFNIISKLKIISKLFIYFFCLLCLVYFFLIEKFVVGFYKIGGYNNLKEKYMDVIFFIWNFNSICGFFWSDVFNIFRDVVMGDNLWLGFFL